MGDVIWPSAFARPVLRQPVRSRARRWIDGRLISVVLAVMALTWILALAGAAFTVRALLVLCFATLAGRARRVGLQRPRLRTSAICR